MDVFEVSGLTDAGRGLIHSVTRTGSIHSSDDSGRTWTMNGVLPGAMDTPEHVVFTSQDTGFVGGSLGSVWRTLDGGRGWERIFLEFHVPWKRFEFFQGGSGLGLNKHVLVRAREGWSKAEIIRWGVEDMQIIGRDLAFLLAGDSMYRSRDAGSTWNPLPWSSPAGMRIRSSRFLDERNGFLILESIGGAQEGPITLYRTRDSGTTWSIVAQSKRQSGEPQPPYAQALFHDTLVGIGWEEIPDSSGPSRWMMARTEDGGRNWSEVPAPMQEAGEPRFTVGPGGDFWMLEHFGSLRRSRDAGKSWERIADGAVPQYVVVHFQDRKRGVALEKRGTLSHTRDGGRTWRPHGESGKTPLRSMHFLDGVSGFAVGDSGKVLKTVDAGETWIPIPFPARSDLHFIHFLDASVGMVGSMDSAYLTTDAGKSWRLVGGSIFSGGQLGAIGVADARQLYISGGPTRRLWTSSDGGASWRNAAPTLTYHAVHAMAFPEPGIHYAMTGTGELLASVDSGLAWELRSVVPGPPWWPSGRQMRMSFTTADTGFVSGSSGLIFSTVDGGRTWTDFRLPSQASSVAWLAATDAPAWAMTSDGKLWENSLPISVGQPTIRNPKSARLLEAGSPIPAKAVTYLVRKVLRDARGRLIRHSTPAR